MRPRLQDRGDLATTIAAPVPMAGFNAATAPRPWRCCADERAQSASRCFNAATAPRPWRSLFPIRKNLERAELQCGHGSKTVEIGLLHDAIQGCTYASMRPRLQDRGDDIRSDHCRIRAIGLQCGHGSKTVEMGSACPSETPRASRLQCGHGSKTVEIPSGSQDGSY